MFSLHVSIRSFVAWFIGSFRTSVENWGNCIAAILRSLQIFGSLLEWIFIVYFQRFFRAHFSCTCIIIFESSSSSSSSLCACVFVMLIHMTCLTFCAVPHVFVCSDCFAVRCVQSLLCRHICCCYCITIAQCTFTYERTYTRRWTAFRSLVHEFAFANNPNVIIFKLADWLLPPYFPYIIHIAFNFYRVWSIFVVARWKIEITIQVIVVVWFRAPFHHHRSNFHRFSKTFWPWNQPCVHADVRMENNVTLRGFNISLTIIIAVRMQSTSTYIDKYEKLSQWNSYTAINSTDVHMWALLMACNLI